MADPRTPPPLRFDLDAAQAAADAWGFNCGPAAVCALLGWTPDELRPHLLDFEARGYTNPTLMADVLRGLRVPFRRVFECLGAREPAPTAIRYPSFGLVRVQWAGPWTLPGVPVAARYRHTHWVALVGGFGHRRVFDVNAICVGGWVSWFEWQTQLVPWLIRECQPKADGRWWPTHCWEVERRG